MALVSTFNYSGSGSFFWEATTTNVTFINEGATEYSYTGSGTFYWTGTARVAGSHGGPSTHEWEKRKHRYFDYKGGVKSQNAPSFFGTTRVQTYSDYNLDTVREMSKRSRASFTSAPTITEVFYHDQQKFVLREDEALVTYFSSRPAKSVREDDDEVLLMMQLT